MARPPHSRAALAAAAACLIVLAAAATLLAQAPAPAPAATPSATSAPADAALTPPPFYTQSLHFTNRGISYWYAKEQGGIERITGVSAEELGCQKSKCHVRSCDDCHRRDEAGRPAYTSDPDRLHATCTRCHPLETEQLAVDVHLRRGMRCLDCHTGREIHGDGTPLVSYMQPGALDARCENCHASVSESDAHTAHGGRLACSACHVKEMTTCFNCHIDTRRSGGGESSIPLKNMFFLVNHDGRVKPANFLSYVAGQKTMITVAPSFSHLVVREGRKCPDCHGTAIVKDIAADRFRPTTWKDGKLTGVEGVIPVVDGMKWDLVFLDRRDGKWTPLERPEPPLLNYAGWCTPLSRAQLAKLEQAQGPAPR